MTWKHFVLLVSMVVSSLAGAQTVPPDRESLLRGEGAGTAMSADLNGYPGPKHVIDLQSELSLTEEQLKDVQSIYDEMSAGAKAKGEEVVKREEELNGQFKTGKANEEDVRRRSAEIGRLRGELRAIHLVAHVHTKSILTPAQVARYMSLRHGPEGSQKHPADSVQHHH